MFGRDDFERLAAQLARIKGKCLLSLNHTPGVREVLGAFDIVEVDTTYTLAKGAACKAGEMLISNFPLPG